MSVGLLLRAKLKRTFFSKLAGHQKPGELLEEMERWIGDFCQDLRSSSYLGERDGNPTLFCRLHPAAEDLEISLIGDGQLTASANTSSAGPGYHIFVCDMLHKLGDRFRLQWEEPTEEYQDETGYFHSGDRDHVFAEMTKWLQTLAGWFFDGTLKDKVHPTRLAMSLDTGFTWNARAITPLGPRDEDWLKAVAQDGNKGQDFFAWWNPGLNAEYFLRRALVRIWSDVRWRPPADDAEKHVLTYIADSLETAYKLDANLQYPWAEWAEILKYLARLDDEHQLVHDRAGLTRPAMGYRRRDVTVQLPGNWWITVPGSFGDFRPDENHNYFALDPPREVWVTSYTFKGDLPALLESQREEIRKKESVLVHEAQNYIAWAEINRQAADGKEWFSLSSSNAGLGNRAVCTIIFTDPEDRDWAIGVWKSLQPPQPPSAQ
jgi:hypothetical protein